MKDRELLELAASPWPFRRSSDKPEQVRSPEEIRRAERAEAARKRAAGHQELAQIEDAPF